MQARSLADRLRPLIAPRSIGVIGEHNGFVDYAPRILQQLADGPYQGDVHLVGGEMRPPGISRVSDMSGLPAGLDCLMVACRIESLQSIFERAAAARIRSILLFTAGLAETQNPELVGLEARLAEIARSAGMLFSGPNSSGLFNFVDRTFLSFAASSFAAGNEPALGHPRGGVGIVTQSGGIGLLLAHARRRGLPVRYCFSTGNGAGVSLLDFLEFLVAEAETRVIVAAIEGVDDGDRFIRLGHSARQSGKAVIVLKTGCAEAGRKMALTHTATMAGRADVYSAAMRKAGIVEVDTPELLLDAAAFFCKAAPAPAGTGAGAFIITNSGGGAILAADAAARHGVPLPAPAAKTVERLRRSSPKYASVSNPCDVTHAWSAAPQSKATMIADCADDPGSAAVVVPLAILEGTQSPTLDKDFGTIADGLNKPLIVVWMSPVDDGRSLAMEAHPRLALFRSFDRCFATLRAWQSWGQTELEPLFSDAAEERPCPPALRMALDAVDHRLPPNEAECLNILSAAGIPVAPWLVANDAEAVAAAADQLGVPVAVKILSRNIAHKSEVGGVAVGLDSPAQASDAASAMLADVKARAPAAKLDGFLVSRMAGRGLEMIVGAIRDERFGPVITIGFGGTAAEILRDRVLLVAPSSRAEVLVAMRQLKGHALLAGHRGAPPRDRNAIAEVALRLADLMRTDIRIDEVEVNPLIVGGEGEGGVAVDAVIRKSTQ
jgi:acyl-CoA synthetase (NDP forming)